MDATLIQVPHACLCECALCTYVGTTEYLCGVPEPVMPRVGKCLKGPEGGVRSPGAGFVSPITDMELGAGLWSWQEH